MANTVERGLVNKSSLTAIGDAIRAKNGGTTKYKPSEMAAAISNLKTGDFTVATSDKFTYKVVQTANQIITSIPIGKHIDNQDGTISLALTDDTTISPNTNYIPGAIQRSYDDSTHTYTVTATDAEPIDGLVQDGWSVVYHKTLKDLYFYLNADYTGKYVLYDDLQGNILIGGMKNTTTTSGQLYPNNNRKVVKYKNNYLTSAYGDNFLWNLSSLVSVELPNLVSASRFLTDCPLIASVEFPNLTDVRFSFLFRCDSLRSVEIPKFTTNTEHGYIGTIGKPSALTPIYFIDFGFSTVFSKDNFYYTQVMILRADTVPTDFAQSKLSDPVLYIVPSALVDTYKSKVRSKDSVTALEESPFADGKTVCGNNMKTTVGHTDFTDIDEDVKADSSTKILVYLPSTQTIGHWEYNSANASYDITKRGLFAFCSKLTKEQGYIIPA